MWQLNLSGGYFVGGDAVKYGLLMAYTVTLLSWSAYEYEIRLANWNELDHVREAIKWGTDYFLNGHPEPYLFYGHVANSEVDKECWERPEDMTTPRDAWRIDPANPGTDLSAETAAALAAASLVFQGIDPAYADLLVKHAKQVCVLNTSIFVNRIVKQ